MLFYAGCSQCEILWIFCVWNEIEQIYMDGFNCRYLEKKLNHTDLTCSADANRPYICLIFQNY